MSYATVAEGDTYAGNRLYFDAWDDATDGDKTKALAQATEIIDRLNFFGARNDEDQANQFPRAEDTDVPEDIKDACVEIAKSLLDGRDPEIEFENTYISQSKIGLVVQSNESTVPEHIVAGVPSITAWRLLKPYLRDSAIVTMSRVS